MIFDSTPNQLIHQL